MRIVKNISMHCPSCAFFARMPILKKDYIKKKAVYTVRCLNCGTTFNSGTPTNFWRNAKSKYKLSAEEISELSKMVLEHVMTYGTVPLIEDKDANLFINGKLVAYRKKN